MLEANPNPNISNGEDFAASALTMGIDYEALMQKIMTLGLSYKPTF
jgi:D-alanine-D-alanine ligase